MAVEMIGTVDHHGNATELKHVERGLIEVHQDGEFIGHVHLDQIVELADEVGSFASDQEAVFHVVCHDCTFEWIMETAEMAERYKGRHAHDRPDHDVEYAEVA